MGASVQGQRGGTEIDRNRTSKQVILDKGTEKYTTYGMAAKHKIAAMGIRAPYLSHAGPKINRMAIVPATLVMLEVQISFFVNSSVIRICDSSGGIANQIKKAIKNPHQEQ